MGSDPYLRPSASNNRDLTPISRWVVFAALYLGYASFGLVVASLGPLITPIRAELGLSQSAMGLILGTWMLIYIGAAIPSGALVDRLGTRTSIAIGVGMIALSGCARAFAVDFFTLFCAVAIFGIGGPLLSIGAPKLITQLFRDDERPMAVGLYLTAPGAGTMLALASSNSVLMPLYAQSWRATLLTYGLVAAATLVIWLVLAKEPARASAGAGHGPAWRAFAELGAAPIMRIVLLMAFAAFLCNHAFNNWLPEMLRARGLDASSASLLATLPVGLGILGGIFITRLATPEHRVLILRTGFAALIIGPLLLAFTDGALLIAGLVLIGLGRVVGGLLMLFIMDAPGVDARNMGAAAGLYFTAGEMGGALGPSMTGALADLGGGFTGGLVALAGVAGSLLALSYVLARALSIAPAPAVSD